MKKTSSILILLGLMTSSLLAHSNSQTLLISEAIEANASPQYTLVYFAEAWNYTRIIVTHPDGKRDRHERRYKRSEAHAIGDFSTLMPILNQAAAKGFKIKSQSVTFQLDENFNHSWHHVYVLEKWQD